jgi:hypothetical protein
MLEIFMSAILVMFEPRAIRREGKSGRDYTQKDHRVAAAWRIEHNRAVLAAAPIQ